MVLTLAVFLQAGTTVSAQTRTTEVPSSASTPAAKGVAGPAIPSATKATVTSGPSKNAPARTAASSNRSVKKTQTAVKATSAKTSSAAAKAARLAASVKRIAAPKIAVSTSKTAGKVDTWSVSVPVAGWDRIDVRDWPVSGQALSAVSKKDSIDVRRRPGIGEPGLRFTKGRSTVGTPTFLVLQDYQDWIMVAIPVRPNGTIGWVKAEEVDRYLMNYRVLVETESNQMIVERDGVEISRQTVATGTGNTPTPTGLFFVREVVTADPTGPYGPYVLGLSGYSDVLNTFADGEGAIGLHGTNQPGLLGTNASFGCVRLTNESIFQLVRQLPIGTPVEIAANLSTLPTERRLRGTPDLVYVQPAEEAVDDGVSILDTPSYSPAVIDFYEPSGSANG